MPTYSYACKSCGAQFDVEQSIKDNTLETYLCPTENTEQPVAKLFRPVGVTFKGSGFYKTDSRGSSSSTKSASNKDSSSSSDSSSDSSSSGSSSAASTSTSTSTTPSSDSGSTSSAAKPS